MRVELTAHGGCRSRSKCRTTAPVAGFWTAARYRRTALPPYAVVPNAGDDAIPGEPSCPRSRCASPPKHLRTRRHGDGRHPARTCNAGSREAAHDRSTRFRDRRTRSSRIIGVAVRADRLEHRAARSPRSPATSPAQYPAGSGVGVSVLLRQAQASGNLVRSLIRARLPRRCRRHHPMPWPSRRLDTAIALARSHAGCVDSASTDDLIAGAMNCRPALEVSRRVPAASASPPAASR